MQEAGDPFRRRSKIARSPVNVGAPKRDMPSRSASRSPLREKQLAADQARSVSKSPVRVKSPKRSTRAASPKPTERPATVTNQPAEKPASTRAQMLRSISVNLDNLSELAAAPLAKKKTTKANVPPLEATAAAAEVVVSSGPHGDDPLALVEPSAGRSQSNEVEAEPSMAFREDEKDNNAIDVGTEVETAPVEQEILRQDQEVPISKLATARPKKASKLDAGMLLNSRKPRSTIATSSAPAPAPASSSSSSPIPLRRSSRGRKSASPIPVRSRSPIRTTSRSPVRSRAAAPPKPATDSVVDVENVLTIKNPFVPKSKLQRSPEAQAAKSERESTSTSTSVPKIAHTHASDAAQALIDHIRNGGSGDDSPEISLEEPSRDLRETPLDAFIDSSLLKEDSVVSVSGRDESIECAALEVAEGGTKQPAESSNMNLDVPAPRALLPAEFKEYLKAFRSPRRKLRRSSVSKGIYLELEQTEAREAAQMAQAAAEEARRQMDLSLNISASQLDRSAAPHAAEEVSSVSTETVNPFASKAKLAHSPQVPVVCTSASVTDPADGASSLPSHAVEEFSAMLEKAEPGDISMATVDENVAPEGVEPSAPPSANTGRAVLGELPVPVDATAAVTPVVETLQSEITRLQAEMAYRLATTTQDRLIEEARAERDSIKTWLAGFEKKLEEKKVEKDKEQDALRMRVINADIEAAKAAVNCLSIEQRLLVERQRTRVSRWASISQAAILAPSSSTSASVATSAPAFVHSAHSTRGDFSANYGGGAEGGFEDMGGGFDDGTGEFCGDVSGHGDLDNLAASIKEDPSIVAKNDKNKKKKRRTKREVEQEEEEYVWEPAPPPSVKGMKFVALDIEPPKPKTKKPKVQVAADSFSSLDESIATPPAKAKAKTKKGKKESAQGTKAKAKVKAQNKGKRVKGKAASKATAKAGKKKDDKPTDKPKRAPSAYIIFSTTVRPAIKSEYPDMGFGDIAREISARWKDLTESEKAEYAPDVALVGQGVKRTVAKAKKVSNKRAAPKKVPAKRDVGPVSAEVALSRFRAVSEGEVRAAQPSASDADVNKLVLMMWNVATDEEKAPYFQSAGEDDVEDEGGATAPKPKKAKSKTVPKPKKVRAKAAPKVTMGKTEATTDVVDGDVVVSSGGRETMDTAAAHAATAVVPTSAFVETEVGLEGDSTAADALVRVDGGAKDGVVDSVEDAVDVSADTVKLNATVSSEADDTLPLDATNDDSKNDSNWEGELEEGSSVEEESVSPAKVPKSQVKSQAKSQAGTPVQEMLVPGVTNLEEVFAPTNVTGTKQRKKLFSFGSIGATAPRLSVLGTPEQDDENGDGTKDKENASGSVTNTANDRRKSRLSSARRKSGVKNSAIKAGSAVKPSLFSALSYATTYQAGIAGATLALKDKLVNPKVAVRPGFQQPRQSTDASDDADGN